MRIEIPYKLPSLSNMSMHWAIKHRLIKKQKKLVKAYMLTQAWPKKGPWQITFTRLGPRLLDKDNAIASFKYIIDAVCEMIFPGLAPGQADSHKDLHFEFRQEKSKKYAIRVEID